MWKNFTDKYEDRFTGTVYKQVTLYVSEIEIWIMWAQKEYEHRNYLIGFLAFLLGLGFGLFLR